MKSAFRVMSLLRADGRGVRPRRRPAWRHRPRGAHVQQVSVPVVTAFVLGRTAARQKRWTPSTKCLCGWRAGVERAPFWGVLTLACHVAEGILRGVQSCTSRPQRRRWLLRQRASGVGSWPACRCCADAGRHACRQAACLAASPLQRVQCATPRDTGIRAQTAAASASAKDAAWALRR